MTNFDDPSLYLGSHDKGYIRITPKVKKLAEKITKGAKTDREKAEKIYEYVLNKPYFFAPATSVDKVLDYEFMDCTSKHTLLATLNRAVGIPTRIALMECPINNFDGLVNQFRLPQWMEIMANGVIQAYSDDIFNGTHMATQVYLDGKWEFMDATLSPRLCKVFKEKEKKEDCLSKKNASAVLGCKIIGVSADIPSNDVIISKLGRTIADILGATNKLRKVIQKRERKFKETLNNTKL